MIKMITFQFKGRQHKLPTNWDEVTYGLFPIVLESRNDETQLLSLFTGLDVAELRTARIKSLDKIICALAFVNDDPEFPDFVKQLGPYKVELLSFQKVEDLQQVYKHAKNPLQAYCKFVSIVGNYSAAEVNALPAYRVIGFGVCIQEGMNQLMKSKQITIPDENVLSVFKHPFSIN